MTNKNKEHCEVGCDSKNFPRGRSPHSSSSLSYLTCVVQPSCLIPLWIQVSPGRGQLVSRQCLSLDRGVCSFDTCLVLSCLVLSCLVWSCLVLYCLGSSWLVLFGRVFVLSASELIIMYYRVFFFVLGCCSRRRRWSHKTMSTFRRQGAESVRNPATPV